MAVSLQAASRCLLPSSSRGAGLCPALAPAGRRSQARSRFHVRSTAQQEQPQHGEKAAEVPPPGGPAGGGSGTTGLPPWLGYAVTEYDKYTARTKELMDQGKERVRETDNDIEEMRADDAPGWILNVMRWTRDLTAEQMEASAQKYEALAVRREGYVAGLRRLAAEMEAGPPPLVAPDETTADWVANAGFAWATQEEESDITAERLDAMLKEAVEQNSSPSTIMWATCVTCLGLSWFLGWAGSWAGIDAYRLFQTPEDLQAAAAAWVPWTVPYVAGTLLAYTLSPPTVTKSIFRAVGNDQQQFFQKIPLYSSAAAALVIAYSECLVYQGLWQDVLTGLLGGSRDSLLLTDPAVLEDTVVKQSMGTLVASPALPAFLVAPFAALLTGLLEAGYFYTGMSMRGGLMTIEVNTEDGGKQGVQMVNLQEAGILSEAELPVVAARVALSGTYLAVEATLTSSLWLASFTGAAGLITAILLSRRGGSGSSA